MSSKHTDEYYHAKENYIKRMNSGMSSSDAYLMMLQQDGSEIANEVFDDVMEMSQRHSQKSKIPNFMKL